MLLAICAALAINRRFPSIYRRRGEIYLVLVIVIIAVEIYKNDQSIT